MILTEKVSMFINYRYVKYYIDLGYNVKGGEIIDVLVNHLSRNSHAKIDVKCDICNKTMKKTYQNYTSNIEYDGKYYCSKCSIIKQQNVMIDRHGVKNPMFKKEFKDKIVKTNLERHGVEYPSQNKDIYNKTKKSFFDKYGVEYISQSEYWRDKIGFLEDNNNFYKYKRLIKNLTHRVKEELFEKWDGKDYYDGEYIKDNLILNYNHILYPTIDHKISIFHGFKNNISIETIANIDNLCITKRTTNSSMKKDKISL